MQYTTLGRTGLRVSRLWLGTNTFGWTSDEKVSFEIMDTAFDAGINCFDTADIYSSWAEGNSGGESETVIGKWLKDKDRRQVIVATKGRAKMWEGANGEGLSRQHIIQAVEDSLKRLQTDYIDLYQTHSPDDDTPLEETLSALDDLVKAGKIRYVGCSNYSAWQLIKASWVADVNKVTRYDCLQPHYSLFNRAEFERELADACLDQNIAVIPYFPIASGFATGKYTRENKEPDSARSSSPRIQRLLSDDKAFDTLDVVREIAETHDVPMVQIALAWLLHKPAVTAPIVGARIAEQLNDVIGAVDVELSEDELKQLDEVTEGF
jgi:aryl-alcohol dehydrogenase-like predicted oxidoreductase